MAFFESASSFGKRYTFKIFSYEYDRMRIEKYLSQSENTYDLEMRIRELEKSGKYNRFYI